MDISNYIVDSIYDAVIMTSNDDDFIITSFNKAAENIFGWKKEEVIGKPVKSILRYSMTDLDRKSVLNRVLQFGEFQAQSYQPTKDNREVFIETRLRAIKNEKGEVLGWLSVNKDISTQKIYEKSWELSETRFKSIFEQAYDGFVITDETGKIVDWNFGMERITNLKKEEVAGLPLYDILFELEPEETKSESQYKKIKNSITNHFENNAELYSNEISERRIQLSDNSIKYVQSIISPVRTQKKLIICNIVRDITHLKSIQDKLNANYEFMQMLMDSMVNPIFIITRDGIIKGCNDIFAMKIIGQNKTRIIDKNIYDMKKPVIKPIVQNILGSGNELSADEAGHIVFNQQIKCADGIQRHFQFYASAFNFDKLDYAGYVGVMADITDMIKIENELKVSKETAETAVRAKNEFLTNMSHEIRTPMNSILGFTEILADREEDELNKNYLNIITASGKTLLTLLNDVLDLSKIETERLVLNMEPVSIEAIFREVKMAFSSKMEEKHLNFIADVEQGLPYKVMFDEVRLRQIIFNLINNAVKYTNAGFVRLAARYKYKQGMEEFIHLTIEVEDSGIGIPDENKPQIFEAFNHKLTGPGRQLDGSGLGLSISKRLTEMLSGTIHLDSTLGKGTKFTLNFPIVEVAREKEIPVNYPTLNTRQKLKFSTIMVAESSDFYRELLKSFVKGFNVKVIDAASCEEVNDLLCAIKPDLILFDVTMNDADPVQTASIIKENEILKDIPIIALGNETVDIESMETDEIFADILKKPILQDTLITTLHKFINISLVKNEDEEILDEDGENLNDVEEFQQDEVDYKKLFETLEVEINDRIKDICENPNAKKIQLIIEDLRNLADTYKNDYLNIFAQSLSDKTKKGEEAKIKNIDKEYDLLIKILKNQEVDK